MIIRYNIKFSFSFSFLDRNIDNYGIIGDIIHSHILQTIAFLAMELPVSLDGEDIQNEKISPGEGY